MDEFTYDRTELNGALVSMEFGPAGKVQRLWVADPNLPEEGEEFQFVLVPLGFGEEFSEDYYPGTIMVGARMNPGEPWIVSRNAQAELVEDEPLAVSFRYELALLPEIEATGKFYEVLTPLPHVVWDVELTNRGDSPVEIGELAFPFALNNFYEGFGRTEKAGKNVWSDRVYLHKFIGGAASYLFAQRLTAEPPGLVVCPGKDTSWEFYNQVPASLNSPYRWGGIPVVYAHSRAVLEREKWPSWANGHSSVMLKPRGSRTYQTLFIPAERDRQDTLSQTLAAFRRPTMKLLPGAVSPVGVGVAVEVGGCTPTQFHLSRPAEMETDSDEEGGFCYVRPEASGTAKLTFEDTDGRSSVCHLCFIEPIDTLIQQRANWIVEHQVLHDPGSSLDSAILPADQRRRGLLNRPEDDLGLFGVEGGLSDALFLAEKNALYPVPAEIDTLERYIDDFVLDDLQNPGDGTVGSAFADSRSVALNYAQPFAYALVFSLYHSMYRVARWFGGTNRDAMDYLRLAALTGTAMLRYGTPRQARSIGMPGYGRVFSLVEDLAWHGLEPELDRLLPLVSGRAEDLLRRDYPYAQASALDPGGFEEVFTAARYLNDEGHQERALRCANAGRSLSPSWWWYASDSRLLEEGPAGLGASDRGELCLGYTTSANSLMFLNTLDRDYGQLSEAYMRLAFGGLLAPWALVRPDGSASTGYCPDHASKHHGFSPVTGDVGFSLYHYLRGAGSYILPSRNYGVFTFGCHFEVEEDSYTVRPWDGVGRKVVMRQVGAEFNATACRIEEVKLDTRKRWALVTLKSVADDEVWAELRVRGLWGNLAEAEDRRLEAVEGEYVVQTLLAPAEQKTLEIKVVE